MRAATIGEDGSLYDADGQRRKTIYRTRGVRRYRFGHFLGQAPVQAASTRPAATPAPVQAYPVSREIAVPCYSFGFTRLDGNPESQLYPGRLVISDRYPNTLFRISARPPTHNDERLVQLAIMEGQGAGTYVEILISPDGTDSPSLLRDFFVVPGELAWRVELVIRTPDPVVNGTVMTPINQGSMQYVLSLLDQASYSMMSVDPEMLPAAFNTKFQSIFNGISTAVSFSSEAIDKVAMAWDFGYIGLKAFKIFVRIGTDIFNRAAELFEMLNLSSPDTIYGTADGEKIKAFQVKVNEAWTMRPYWSGMLSRAQLLTAATEIGNLVAGKRAAEAGEEFSLLMKHRMMTNRSEVENLLAMTPGENGSVMSLDQARAYVDAGNATLDQSFQATEATRASVSSGLKNLFGKSLTIDQLPMALVSMESMLSQNALLCMKTRAIIRDQGGSPEECYGVEGLGAGPAPAGSPGLDYRSQVADRIDKALGMKLLDLSKKFKDDPDPRARGLESIRASIGAILGSVRDVLGWKNIADVPTASSRQQEREAAAVELNRSIANPELLGEATKRSRKADVPYESYTKEALENLKSQLETAEKLLGDVPRDQAGFPKPSVDWTPAEIDQANKNREEAIKVFSKAMTTGLIRLKEGGGFESIAVSYLVSKRAGRVIDGLEVVTEIMDAVLKSGLFDSSSAIKGELYRITANDLGVTTDELREYLSDKVKEFTDVTTDADTTPDQKNRAKDKINTYTAILSVIGLPEMTEAQRQQMAETATWRDALAAAAKIGKVLSAPPGVVTNIASQLAVGTEAINNYAKLLTLFEGDTADPSIKMVMSAKVNADLVANMKKAYTAMKSAQDGLAKLSTPESLRQIADGKMPLDAVEKAISSHIEKVTNFEIAAAPVEQVARTMSFSLFGAKIIQFVKYFWQQTSLKGWIEISKHNWFTGAVVGLLGVPLHYGILWSPILLILGLPQKEYNPGFIVVRAFRGIVGLLPDPRVGDLGAAGESKPEGKPGISNLLLVAGAVAVIVFGKQLFPAIGEFFKALEVSLKTLTQVIPGVKKKGKGPGRPRLKTKTA